MESETLSETTKGDTIMAHRITSRADIRQYRQRYTWPGGYEFILTDSTVGECYCLDCGTDKHTVTQAWIDGHELYLEHSGEYDDLLCSGCGKQLSAYSDD